LIEVLLLIASQFKQSFLILFLQFTIKFIGSNVWIIRVDFQKLGSY